MSTRAIRHRLIYGLLLASGFSALIYEITWSRHLALLFGSNMLAVGTVTATFMAGLAIGSLLFGRRSDRSSNPLRLYALLEAGIAVTALLFPLWLGLIRHAYIALSQHYPESAVLLEFGRVLLAALLLLPPTICMGGTLPVVCRFLKGRQLGAVVGRLYAVNTLGAVAGCLLGGFWLIPQTGMLASQLTAVALNAIVAVLAWRLGGAAEHAMPPETRHDASATPKAASALLLTGALLVGATALALEMLWTRLFLLFLGNTTYAFATILAVYLCGLTAGGAVYARLFAASDRQARVYLALLATLLLCVLASLPAYDQLGFLFEAIHRQANDRWWYLSGASFGAVALVVLLPAACSGALLPCTVALFAPEPGRVGGTVGRVLFWNTLGAMAGSFLGVFAITRFGLQNSFKASILPLLLFGALFAWTYRATLRPARIFTSFAVATLLLILPTHWDQGLMNSGIYIYAHYYLNSGGLGRPGLATAPERVVEGLETTAAFFRTADGFKEFRVNGKSDGGTRPGDMKTQILLGQLPLHFHPEATNALVIGLGTGITLRQILDYPAMQIDCAEISPEVAEIAAEFAEENGRVLDEPRIRLQIRDGRNLLLTNPQRYDVIISEPSNPWQTGNANLFTREFYALAAARLQPRGVFCQWLPLYDLPVDRLRIALKTFASSFSQVRVFVLGGDMVLLGSLDDAALALERFTGDGQTEAVLSQLRQAGLTSGRQLLERYYFGNRQLLETAAGAAPLNTDDLPHLEFSRQTGRNLTQVNLAYLVEVRRRLGEAGTR